MGRCINGGVIVAATIGWFCGVPLSGLAAPVGLGAVIGSAAGVAMVNKQQNYYEASEVFGRVIWEISLSAWYLRLWFAT